MVRYILLLLGVEEIMAGEGQSVTHTVISRCRIHPIPSPLHISLPLEMPSQYVTL